MQTYKGMDIIPLINGKTGAGIQADNPKLYNTSIYPLFITWYLGCNINLDPKFDYHYLYVHVYFNNLS